MAPRTYSGIVTPSRLGPDSGMTTPDILDSPRNPFESPGSIFASQHGSRIHSTRASAYQIPGGSQNYFRSRRIDGKDIPKPWLEKKDPRRKWHCIIPLIGIFVGIGLTGLLVYEGYKSVINYDYCPVYMEDFSSGKLDEKIWTKEAQVGGFGNGQFEETTTTDENVFIKDGELWIKPSLQDPKLVNVGHAILDLKKQGICTGSSWADCVAITNTTNGTLINPVRSARINTKKGATIQYGRVEVEAMLPEGDWMWPAIWMLPVKNNYGTWPASGEIDIVESRGNNWTYPLGGNDIAQSTLHWGPSADEDSWWRNFVKVPALHSTYAKKYHTYGIEWSPKYFFTYIDTRLREVLYVSFNKPFWDKGHFPPATNNGTRLIDPWSQTGRFSTPFDVEFYLILDVAVGGTNGWWTDGKAAKPWVDASSTAKRDFYAARDQWLPTWKDNGQMRIKSVKMWQQAGYKGCKV